MVDDNKKLKIAMLSLHGLIRSHEPELGHDSDTGVEPIAFQIVYCPKWE